MMARSDDPKTLTVAKSVPGPSGRKWPMNEKGPPKRAFREG
jgi:hypothetical protein